MKNLVPRLKPNYDFNDWLSVLNVFKRSAVSRYEKAFAETFDCNYGVMFSHGRSGLFALMKVWELSEAEVICPAYTCVVVPNAIVLSGNTPVFVDCAKGSFNMDLNLLEASITDKTRCIVATHLFGYPMDVEAVQTIADKASEKYGHKVYVVQDCAHSYGAKWKGKLVTSYGDASIFGSNVSKIINSIFGGVVTTNSDETYQGLLSWRTDNCKKKRMAKPIKRLLYFIAVNVAFFKPVYTFVNFLERKGFLDRFVKYYEDGVIDFPSDWDQMPVAIEARVGLSQISKYQKIIENRVANAKNIISRLENEKVDFIDDDSGCTYSHLVGVVKNRDEWVERYREESVQLGILIEYSIPEMKAYTKYKRGSYPVSEFYANHTINFPVHSEWLND